MEKEEEEEEEGPPQQPGAGDSADSANKSSSMKEKAIIDDAWQSHGVLWPLPCMLRRAGGAGGGCPTHTHIHTPSALLPAGCCTQGAPRAM